jgi:hypothetical protein
MFTPQRNHALGLSGLLLLLAVIFEIVSASSYPKIPHTGKQLMHDARKDAQKLENISKFHNLAMVFAVAAVAAGVHATALDNAVKSF